VNLAQISTAGNGAAVLFWGDRFLLMPGQQSGAAQTGAPQRQ